MFMQDSITIPFPPEDTAEDWRSHSNRVKNAFLHAYHAYERYAAPSDELLPISRGAKDKCLNGWGVSAFDSLDTMLLMGLGAEYNRSLTIVRNTEFKLPNDTVAPYFETVIRYLGGMLSAYAMSNDSMLLNKAQELAIKLDPVFETDSGLPKYGVNPTTGQTQGPDTAILAEMATLQLEYSYLAKLTGNKVDTLVQALANADLRNTGGMLPLEWDLSLGFQDQTGVAHLSVGAAADSAHEYLLKQYLLTARTDKQATTHIISDLFMYHPPETFFTSRHENLPRNPGYVSHVLEHLIASSEMLRGTGIRHHSLLKYDLKQLHLWAADGLAQTCWLTYADQPSGLGPEEVRYGSRGPPPGVGEKKPVIYNEAQRLRGSGRGRDYQVKKAEYLLRPETIESLYILWRVTGDPKWRRRGLKIFQAIESQTRTPVAYASVRTVELSPAPKKDDMPSYFLAETLKYLYLLFSDQDLVPLETWVFNTEAHPFPVFEWTPREKELFHI
ncbi:glycoside hydrolase [Infundibulicybe gibba]|nr:glycoside hydrolase [Infundibulicybe gibba]